MTCELTEWAGLTVCGCSVQMDEDGESIGYWGILNVPNHSPRFKFCPECGDRIDYALADRVRAEYMKLGRNHPRDEDGRPTRPYPIHE